MITFWALVVIREFPGFFRGVGMQAFQRCLQQGSLAGPRSFLYNDVTFETSIPAT